MPRHEPAPSGRSLARSTLRRRLGRRRLELAERIVAVARRRGWATYLVGGVVRDLLLDRATKDLDLVVVGDAPAVARSIAQTAGARFREHEAFGTASVEFDDALRFDLASARSESYVRPAALPRTAPSSLHDDLRRRDFTINSMALDLSAAHFGEVIDPLEGQSDLRRRLVRVLHDRSFRDDPTRIFRAVRFSNRLGFAVEEATERLMRQSIARGGIDRLSATRLRRELELLFDEAGWAETVATLGKYGGWNAVEPALGLERGDAGRVERAESWAEWYAASFGTTPIRRWVLALATLLHGRRRKERERVVRRLRPERRDACELVEAPDRALEMLKNLRAARHPRPSRVFRICEGASVVSCLLALSDTRAGAVRQALCAFLLRFRAVQTDLSGDDLLRAGVPAGPLVGRGLRAALEAKLDGRATSAKRQLAVAIRATRRGA
jgi:tRNA nucleotidyltransferase (CCA-adding enzyme)